MILDQTPPPKNPPRLEFAARLRALRLPAADLLAEVFEERVDLRLAVALLVVGGLRRAADLRLDAREIVLT